MARRVKRTRTALLAAALWMIAAGAAWGDVILTHGGTRLEGKVTDVGSTYVVNCTDGRHVVIAKRKVKEWIKSAGVKPKVPKPGDADPAGPPSGPPPAARREPGRLAKPTPPASGVVLHRVALFPAPKGGKWGYIDKSGRMVIQPVYDGAGDFSEGLAAVGKGEKYGFIDETGRRVIPCRYAGVNNFSEGLAAVRLGTTSWIKAADFLSQQGSPSGFIDVTGRTVLPIKYDLLNSFSDGVALVKTLSGRHTTLITGGSAVAWDFNYTYIDKTGKTVLAPACEDARDFAEGLAPVKVKGLWGYIDKKGQTAIKPQFDNALPFSEGLAAVAKDGKYRYINAKGQIAIALQFKCKWAYRFSEGLAKFKSNGKVGYLGRTGRIAIQPRFDGADQFRGGLALVKIGKALAYIDRNGKYIWGPTK